MSNERRVRLWSLVVEQAHGDRSRWGTSAAAAISAAGVDGAAVTVTLSATPRETVYASDRTAAELEELTLTLGEGPGVDALAGGPALVADLTARGARRAGRPSRRRGRRRSYGRSSRCRCRSAAIRLGVMDLYRAGPGDSTTSSSPTRCCWPTPRARCCSTPAHRPASARRDARSRPARSIPRSTRPPA